MQEMRIRIYLFVMMSALVTSCGEDVSNVAIISNELVAKSEVPTVDPTSSESVAAYMNEVKSSESGLLKKVEFGDYSFEILVEPAAYSALQFHKSVYSSPEEFERDATEQSEITQIELEIKNKSCAKEILKCDTEDAGIYNERIKYFSFELYKDVYLVYGSDTIPCGMHVWERGFNAKPELSCQLVFDAIKIQDDTPLELVYNDKVFGNGLIKFRF
jgi:hypothetical protein